MFFEAYFLRRFSKIFWGNHCHLKLLPEIILNWRNPKIVCCYRLAGTERRLTNQDYRLTLKTIMLLRPSKQFKRKDLEILKSHKGRFRNTRRFSFLVQKELSAEFIRVYADQFFWAIIVCRLN